MLLTVIDTPLKSSYIHLISLKNPSCTIFDEPKGLFSFPDVYIPVPFSSCLYYIMYSVFVILPGLSLLLFLIFFFFIYIFPRYYFDLNLRKRLRSKNPVFCMDVTNIMYVEWRHLASWNTDLVWQLYVYCFCRKPGLAPHCLFDVLWYIHVCSLHHFILFPLFMLRAHA